MDQQRHPDDAAHAKPVSPAPTPAPEPAPASESESNEETSDFSSELDSPTSGDEFDAPPPAGLGHYRIEGELGRGGMGVVYLGRDTRLGREVALKILPKRLAGNPAALARFEREAQLLAALNHPNVATIHSLEEFEGLRFLTMERINGESLSHRLSTGALSIDRTLAIARQIAAALQATHQKGIVHRDLKPANVMLGAEDHVKVLDFGIATAFAASAERDSAASGTPGHMSPEQARNEEVDPRTDIWAFGCLLYHCLSGAAAFPGRNASERIEATLRREPDWSCLSEEAPAALRALLESCLQKDAAKRPTDATEIRRIIEELIALRSMTSPHLAKPGVLPSGGPSDTTPTNLPISLSAFIGREKQRAEIVELTRHHRLVTLIGFGGAGKTRLSLEVARELLATHSDGVWLVELASLLDPELLPQTILAELQLRAKPNQTGIEALVDALKGKTLVLVLDNCEHLIAPTAEVARALLEAAPHVQIIATSREALGLPGETLYSVPGLTLPKPGAPAAIEELLGSEAVRLFVERAQAHDPRFALTPENAPHVAEICHRLDGIALALELAAARIRVLPPKEIAARLNERFRLLRGGNRTALPHHQTLHALVDWSHDQLSAGERAVLRRLSVLAGSWSLEAAEQVCAGDPIEEWEVLDHLTRLVERSLVEVDAEAALETGQARYRLLETVREYARERLVEAGEEVAARSRQAHWCEKMVMQARNLFGGPERVLMMARFEMDHPNIRAALAWCLEHPADEPLGQNISANAISFWGDRGHAREGLRWLESYLARESLQAPTLERARALHGAGNMCFTMTDMKRAGPYFEEAAAIRGANGARRAQSWSLGNLASVAQYTGHLARARELFGELLEITVELDDAQSEAITMTCLGSLEYDLGHPVEAESWTRRAVDRSHEIGAVSTEAYALSNLGLLLLNAERFDECRTPLERCVELFRQLGNRQFVAINSIPLASLENRLGNSRSAESAALESMRLLRDIGAPRDFATGLYTLSQIAASLDQPERATTLLVAGRHLLEELGTPSAPHQIPSLERRLAELRQRLGDELFERASRRGAAMKMDEAMEFAVPRA